MNDRLYGGIYTTQTVTNQFPKQQCYGQGDEYQSKNDLGNNRK